MWENIILAILGGGNIVMFAKFLIERHDRKAEREEDKEDNAVEHRLRKVEKDVVRTQLLILIILTPDNDTEILNVAEYYFQKLKANWYMTGLFKNWCEEHGLEPEWFDGKG